MDRHKFSSKRLLIYEEEYFIMWKQGNTPEKNFEPPAFGGGFFLTGHLPFLSISRYKNMVMLQPSCLKGGIG